MIVRLEVRRSVGADLRRAVGASLRLAVKSLHMLEGSIERLSIEELEVGRLRIRETVGEDGRVAAPRV